MRLTKYNKKTEQHRSWRVLALWPPVASDTASVPLHLAFLLPLFLFLLLILILRYGICPSTHRLLLLLLSFFSLHLLFSHLLPHSPIWLFLHLDFHPRYILQPAHSRLGLSHLRDRIFVFVLSLSLYLYLYSSQLYPAISALKIGISAPR